MRKQIMELIKECKVAIAVYEISWLLANGIVKLTAVRALTKLTTSYT